MAGVLTTAMGLAGTAAALSLPAAATTGALRPHPATVVPPAPLGSAALPPGSGSGVKQPSVTRPAPTKPTAAQLSTARAVMPKLRALASRPAPLFSSASATTFKVNSTVDSPNANPTTGTTCVDTETTPACSLRAAVQAADNLGTPVVIDVPGGTYQLSTDTPLVVSDPGGISIVGAGESATTVDGLGATEIIDEAPASSTSAPSELFLSGLSLADGGAVSDGGAISVSSGSGAGAVLSLDKVQVEGSSASSEGGGIYAYYSTVYLTDSTIIGNSAPEGGGLYADASVVKASGTKIASNSTGTSGEGYGGGVYLDYDVFEMSGGSVRSNHAGYLAGSDSGWGGGIYDDELSTVALSGTVVNDNVVSDGGGGGAIYAYYDTVTVSGGLMSHNSARGTDGSGGAVYDYDAANIKLVGVKMAADAAGSTAADGYGGGAIYDYSYDGYTDEITIKDSTISGANNSAVYGDTYEDGITWNVSGTTFSNNSDASSNADYGSSSDTTGCGGALCAYQSSYGHYSINLRGDTFEKNSSAGYFSGGAVSVFGNYGGTALSMSKDTFSDNVTTGAYGSGALLLWNYDYPATTLSVDHSVFSGNKAADDGLGGAIDVYGDDEYDSSSVDLSADKFSGNVAGSSSSTGWGGAIYTEYYVNLTDQGSSFTDNRAIGSSSESAGGGAIYDEAYESEVLDGTKFSGNKAVGSGGYGGAVYNEDEAGASYTDVTMTGNSAEYGGGLYDESYTTSVKGSTFSHDTAIAGSTDAGYGGAIYSESGPLSVTNSTFAGDSARSEGSTPGYGGAIYSDSGTPLAVDYSTLSGNWTGNVSGNTAPTGGALYSDTSTGSIRGSIVSGNSTRVSGTSTESDCGASAVKYGLASAGHNVFGDRSCSASLQSSDIETTKLGLSALGAHGGPTATMALEPYSRAIGNGGRATCPATDQRGVMRPQGAHCDSGAYELAQGLFAVNSRGEVQPAGGAAQHGWVRPAAPVVAIASTPDHEGYYVLTSHGNVYTRGDARFRGSLPSAGIGTRPGFLAVGIAVTADGGGYWIAQQNGSVHAFGDAKAHGGVGHRLSEPGSYLAGMAATPNGGGYWLLGRNGSVYGRGNARYHGSLPGRHISTGAGSYAVALVPSFNGGGYWIATQNGHIFQFGDAAFYGSYASRHISLGSSKVVGLVPTPDHLGYAGITNAGAIHGFGDASAEHLRRHITVAAAGVL